MSPVAGAAAENATLFTAFGQSKLYLHGTSPEPMKMRHVLMSGAFAGIFVSFVLTPVELVKCRLQVQLDSTMAKYKGPVDAVVKIVREEGVTKGLFKGHAATLMREIPGNAAWFFTYETIMRKLIPPGGTKEDVHPVKIAGAGAISGMAYWTAFFPADVVKSKLQTLPPSSSETFLSLFKTTLRNEGVPGLYRGLSITLVRAVPANAIIFLTYETVSKMLR